MARSDRICQVATKFTVSLAILKDVFGAGLNSERFVKLMKKACDRGHRFDDFRREIMLARDARQRGANPHHGLSRTKIWTPADAGQALVALEKNSITSERPASQHWTLSSDRDKTLLDVLADVACLPDIEKPRESVMLEASAFVAASPASSPPTCMPEIVASSNCASDSLPQTGSDHHYSPPPIAVVDRMDHDFDKAPTFSTSNRARGAPRKRRASCRSDLHSRSSRQRHGRFGGEAVLQSRSHSTFWKSQERWDKKLGNTPETRVLQDKEVSGVHQARNGQGKDLRKSKLRTTMLANYNDGQQRSDDRLGDTRTLGCEIPAGEIFAEDIFAPISGSDEHGNMFYNMLPRLLGLHCCFLNVTCLVLPLRKNLDRLCGISRQVMVILYSRDVSNARICHAIAKVDLSDASGQRRIFCACEDEAEQVKGWMEKLNTNGVEISWSTKLCPFPTVDEAPIVEFANCLLLAADEPVPMNIDTRIWQLTVGFLGGCTPQFARSSAPIPRSIVPEEVHHEQQGPSGLRTAIVALADQIKALQARRESTVQIQSVLNQCAAQQSTLLSDRTTRHLTLRAESQKLAPALTGLQPCLGLPDVDAAYRSIQDQQEKYREEMQPSSEKLEAARLLNERIYYAIGRIHCVEMECEERLRLITRDYEQCLAELEELEALLFC